MHRTHYQYLDNNYDCSLTSPHSLGEGCKKFSDSLVSIVGGNLIAGTIGWTLGGPFGLVVGIMVEYAGSCLLGVGYTAINNCVESYIDS